MNPTDHAPIDAPREFARIAALALLAAVALALIGYLPTVAQTGSAGAAAMAVGIAVALLGGWLGSLPPFYFIHRPVQEFPAGILGSLMVRFVATLGIALGVRAIGLVPDVPMLIWVGIGQTVILGVDTIGLLRLARKVARAKA